MSKQRTLIIGLLTVIATAGCGKKEAPTPPAENVPATSPLSPPPAPARLPESTSATPAASPTPTPAAPASAPVPPQPPQLDLAKRSGCLACHSIEKKVVGPAWDEVSKRYAGDATAKTRLVEKVKKGGKGNWLVVTGGATMPPYSPRVSDADIETLVDFVLGLQKK